MDIKYYLNVTLYEGKLTVPDSKTGLCKETSARAIFYLKENMLDTCNDEKGKVKDERERHYRRGCVNLKEKGKLM